MNYYELLKSYIRESGLSLFEISEKLKDYGYQVSKGYISQLQNGKTNPATVELNRALAAVTGGDVETLLTAALIEKAPDEIKEKFERLALLKQLKSEYKEAWAVNESLEPYLTNNLVKIPLLSSISAGQPIDQIELIEDFEYVNKSVLLGGDAFALSVKGDSMIGDNILGGDIVICVKKPKVSPTDIAVVAVEKEAATIKKVKCQDNICVLMPSNSKFQPTIVQSSNVQIIGKVIEVRRRL
ncbi:helix-turn-helix domain-containing protein [Paenibacillus larvae]|uniref:LexA repressor n=1 Tax=Paenibacillus larvae subsp. larvae TaxID=147375 RepID=A0A6C0QQV9_9BACL|nr:LexA family transcriptional regulator [Paenibacillus larvae]QHZ50871.1 LexA repressor [Paenibacillus larvae subsp. larvae]